MSREVPFDPAAVCDACGATGAYDFMGDLYCRACADAAPHEDDDTMTDDTQDRAAARTGSLSEDAARHAMAHPMPFPSPDVREAARDDLMREISAELTRARTKFPGPNVTFAALVEEVGELATALFEEPRERVRKEAVQVAVMAMRVVLDGDATMDGWRQSKGLDALARVEAEHGE